MHQFQRRCTQTYHPIEHPSNDHKDRPNQHKNSHKLCNEKRHLLRLNESKWKMRPQHDQNFRMEGTQS